MINFLKDALAFLPSVTDALVYAAIVVMFVLGIVKCVVPVARNQRQLGRAIRQIKQGASAKKSWQEDKFLGKGSLFPHWSEYLNNLFFADGVYHNASNVEDYINEETAIYGPGRSSFAESIPGLLVSLGFLGTLIGLAKGLSGFNMDDATAVQSSIVTLIPGMRYAFMTSIVGVVGSVSFSLIYRTVAGSSEHTLKNFYGAMSRYAGVLSVDPMTQIAIYQQEQTALIQTMAKDLNGAFTQHMAEAMAATVEPINQNLKNFITVSTKEQMRFLDAVAQRFVERTEEMLRDDLDELSQAVSDAARGQKESLKAVRDGMDAARDVLEGVSQMGGAAQNLMGTFGAYVESLSGSQSQVDDAYMRVSGNLERMDVISRQQSAYLKTVTAMQSDVTASVNQLRDAIADFTGKLSEQTEAATAGLTGAADSLQKTGSELEKIHQQAVKGIDKEIGDTLDAFSEYASQLTKRVDYLASAIANSLSQLPHAVDETSGQFLEQMKRMGDSLQDAQQALDAAVDRLYEQGK